MMKTVTSVSGGKTSSYMAIHYPTDYNIFSLVRIEDKRCAPKDTQLIRYVEDKIQKPFIATAESVKTLYCLQQLEQDLGKDIIWVTGDTFEHILYNTTHKNSLPNRRMRYCTSDMKMLPIFWYCYLYIMQDTDDLVSMNIGYRADEPKRQATDFYKFAISGLNGRNNWTEMEWRESEFPLKKAGVNSLMIKSYFANKPQYPFPKYSNCAGCFNKNEAELQEQFVLEPELMQWFKDQEIRTGRTWNISGSLEMIQNKDLTNGQSALFEHVTCNCTD